MKAQLEEWPAAIDYSQRILRELSDTPANFKNSYHGPLNSVFSHIFPPESPGRFVVHPRALLRKPLRAGMPGQGPEEEIGEGLDEGLDEESDEESEADSDASICSWGYPTQPGRGAERGNLIPDYMVRQYDPTGHILRAMLLAEVKAGIELSSGDFRRFTRYISRLKKIGRAYPEQNIENVVVMLIAGGRVYHWYFHEWPTHLSSDDLQSRDFVLAHEPGFLNLLMNIRAQNSPYGWGSM